ncbi:MAG: YggT family protein [Dehalococcoidia bacterium]|nr:MAG: YggT family protein [Dehalococcoidia bacterium]
MAFFLSFIRVLCEVLTVVIILRAVLSWFQISPTNILAVVLHRITEPVLAPLRRVIPRTGIIDFSPLVAILLLQLIIRLLP